MSTESRVSTRALFFAFAKVGLSGFGGVMPFVYKEIVEDRKWLSDEEFAEMIGMGQLLPGANVTNFAAMFGYRMAGWRGVGAAIAGILGPPAVVIYLLFQLYSSLGQMPIFQGALRGILAATSALILVTGFKLMRAQKLHASTLGFGLLAVVAVGILHLPLLYVLLVLAPTSFFVEWRRLK